jgi:hypothetical protein
MTAIEHTKQFSLASKAANLVPGSNIGRDNGYLDEELLRSFFNFFQVNDNKTLK